MRTSSDDELPNVLAGALTGWRQATAAAAASGTPCTGYTESAPALPEEARRDAATAV